MAVYTISNQAAEDLNEIAAANPGAAIYRCKLSIG